jgi:hypothetical protein
VEAVNAHGAGESSSRIVFRTASRKVEDLITQEHPYNQTECCLKSGLKPECKQEISVFFIFIFYFILIGCQYLLIGWRTLIIVLKLQLILSEAVSYQNTVFI